MTRPDPELASWMEDWQSGGSEPAAEEREAIRRRVKRRTRGLILLAAGELVFSAGVLAFLLGFALRHPHPADRLTMAGLALITLSALGFAAWNRRGLWKARAETTAAFLDLSLVRCRRRQQSLRFAWGMLAVEAALFVPWIWHRLHLDRSTPPSPAEYLGAYGFLAAVCAVTAVVLVGLERWTRRELRQLEAMRGQQAARKRFP